jgi:N-methylhydantoinase A
MAGISRIAADIGGTFTDIALLTDTGRLATWKLPSTPPNFADAVITGITRLLAELEAPLVGVEQVLHGCTVATNAILEYKGAKTALITTRGFRDILELQRIRMPMLYKPLYKKPVPLVPRRLRLEVTERLNANGDVHIPLNENDVTAAIEILREEKVEAIAVCLLHSYANPGHERRIGEMLRAALPDVYLSLSIDVLPQMREYERTSTTVVNSYVGPPVASYIQAMIDELAKAGIGGRLMVMQSSGGIIDAQSVIRRPAQIVECGPAAGVIGARKIGAISGYADLISFDMGGTTAKASIIEKGQLSMAAEYEVGGGLSANSALGGGSGYALKLPVIDISEVGAGGGSIVWLDKAGAMKVGPESAGAVPGPACYGISDQPTVTDANVVLGYLNPTALAGGSVPIDAELSRRAIESRIAGALGRSVLETAYGIHLVANANMMRAVKAVTTYRGRDPRAFTMIAFGGNGGIHAVDLARTLQIKEVIVPLGAGVFSAVGLLFSNLELNELAPFLHIIDTASTDDARAIYQDLRERIVSVLGVPDESLIFRPFADARYKGQAFELTVPVDPAILGIGDASHVFIELAKTFQAEHIARYGHDFGGTFAVELVNLRLVGTAASEAPGDLSATAQVRRKSEPSRRQVYFGPTHGLVDTPVVDRGAFGPAPQQGPFIVEEYEGTAVVPPDCTAMLDPAGNLIVTLP